MFDAVRMLSDLWVAAVMAGLLAFWLRDVDAMRWQELLISAIALPPVALTLWRALVSIFAGGI